MGNLSVFNKFVYFLNSIAALLLLFSCIVPYISLQSVSFLFIFSLAVPYLVVVNALFLMYWVVNGKRQFLLSFTVLAIGYFSLGTFIKFFEATPETAEESLRVLTFNTQSFQGNHGDSNPQSSDSIVKFIKEENADIVCFQEFDKTKVSGKDFKQYPYKYVDFEFGVNNDRVIQAIYSKFPIINKGSLEFPNSSNNAIFADVVVKMDTVRIYNLHLQSLKVRPGSIKREESQKLLKRLNTSFIKQQEQASIVLEHSRATTFKKIIVGDFNNSQYSNVYYDIKGDMKDTFIEMGSGYGRTYNFKFLPLRIDFILVDEKMEVLSHKNYNVKLSDHFPVMASVKL
ncbi:endonuclease/exonuclease/phosphatase family protein [Sediminicola sp. 1XM1-17]|uniref:endonuclease/exonuclease/phosphatase family protein n=1 Tax=Sediminicola sp. 1XM1-17 TaxID=3127702 RepID=UPI00307830E6